MFVSSLRLYLKRATLTRKIFSALSFRSKKKRAASRSLQDLPNELLLELYLQFDHVSQIVALNSTSRLFYEIWRLDPDGISSAVLPRSIAYYGATVEIQEAAERQQKVDPYGRPSPQKGLRALLEGCLATSPVSLNKPAYAAILERNRRLVRIANKADILFEACRTSGVKDIGREHLTQAFHRIWLMTVRNSRNTAQHKADLLGPHAFADDRFRILYVMDPRDRDCMAQLVKFFLFECSGEVLVKLGISRIQKQSPAKCSTHPHWISELLKVAFMSRDMETFHWLLAERLSVCKDC